MSLFCSIYPILAQAQSKAAQILVLGIAGLHFVFAVLLWFYFLNAGDASVKKPAAPPSSDSSKAAVASALQPS